ncbi:MAG: hypothetical protein V4673_18270 [Pseudomonadota bacterium]
MAEFKYKPVDCCIYCMHSSVELSDEHIIPYGLNGTRILPKSSCLECAKITSRIEFDLLRGEMHLVRAALSFQTRRPKKMPTKFPLLITQGGVERKIDVPLEEHLVILPLPLYQEPSFIKPYNYKNGIALTGVQTLRFGPSPEDLLKKYAAEKVGFDFLLNHNIFARLLAKIAYSLAVAELGLEKIGKAYVLPIILGDMTEAGRWIGTSDEVLVPESADTQHTSNILTCIASDELGDKSIIIALIRLFANVPSPRYIVVVGELR